VEGDSAGGSAKQGRNRKFQAILPLKGKILNVEKARFDKMLASQEVGTLITALGCGIGKDDFDPDRLRYHKIIIMTDADVDGSHIRTLLLTFFYRQMPELIERGHIYIGQAPLYKVKQGKQEVYLKDDAELNDYLLARALDKASLIYEPDSPPVAGEQLESLIKDYQQARKIIQRHSQHHDPYLLQALLEVPIPEDLLENEESRKQWAAAMAPMIRQKAQDKQEVVLEWIQDDSGQHYLQCTRVVHGLSQTSTLPLEWFHSRDFQTLQDWNRQYVNLIRPGAEVQRGESSHTVRNLEEVEQWLMQQASRGQTIQRFKGLGEMNPDQLWETTVNPETRRLLQVTIEDAVQADEIFATLMGDVVEPRREFIEQNALRVSNLDI